MQLESRPFWTPEQIATLAQIDPADVLKEIDAGRIKAVRFAGKPRVPHQALMAFLGPALPLQGTSLQEPTKPTSAILHFDWKSTADFEQIWPDGTTRELYTSVFEAETETPNGARKFQIGYTMRETSGMNRRRIVVFRIDAGRRIPIVEFTGTNDFASTKRVVSVIKNPDNKNVRTVAQLPPEYVGFPTILYSDVVIGPYATKSLAVLAQENDRDLMLRHALIRGKYKE